MGFVPCKREKAFLKRITFVTGQRNRLFWDLPAEEYFEFCRAAYEIPKAVYERNRRDLVALAEIGDILKVPQRKLSFGQRKRCELVAALLHDPSVIFLDEPTNAMDLINAKKIRDFVKRKGSQGKCTIILTSHNMSDIEQVCDKVVIINQGEIVFDGGIRALSQMNGHKKQIRVVFNGPWNRDEIEKLGQIIQMNSEEVSLEVEPHEATSVASHLFANHDVKDMAIADPSLEKIIESIYLRSN
jgi:ABC-2 type transport system ATP-binding protein